MSGREAWALVKQTFAEWWEHRVSRLAASLAYYTAFSIAPLLIIAVRVAGLVFDEASAREEVSAQLRGLMGPEAADAVEALLEKAAAPGSGGTLATVLGVAFFIYAATNLFAELQDAMNTIWDVKPKPDAGWWPTVRGRLLSFAMVLGTGFLLMVSLVLSAALAAASRYLGGGGDTGAVWRAVNLAASLGVFTVMFAMIFKLLPDVLIRWRDVLMGAAATAVLFTLGKFLISLYLARPTVSSVYGAAGSLAILLIWVYYSAHVLFLGAEFTQVYARRHGRRIRPDPGAVRVTAEDRARRGIPRVEHVRAAARDEEAAPREQSGPPPAPARAGVRGLTRHRVLLPLLALFTGFLAGRLTRRR